MNRFGMALGGLMLFAFLSQAQETGEEKGFELGIFKIRPEAEVLGAYDNRVVINPSGNNADGDVYGEVAAALYLNNIDSRYEFYAKALLGYRFYETYTGLNNSFYDTTVLISSSQNPLKLGLSAHLKKSLDYDSFVDANSGGGPSSILTAKPSERFSSKANVGYEKQVTDKTSIKPSYDFWYYLQDFDEKGRSDEEWVVHRGSLELGYGYTQKTLLTLSGYYSLQMNDEENGNIGTVAIGARSRSTDKTGWVAQIGLAVADYEVSGTGQSVVSQIRASWQATEKVSTYILGGNHFQPGSGNKGGAQIVYRLGYGVDWRMVSRWRLKAQVLHDYTEDLIHQASSNSEDIKHFLMAQTTYDLTRQIALSLTGKYINDELDADQMIISLGVGFNY